MFKIMLNAMWSKDYLPQLAQVLADSLPCELEEAFLHIRALTEGKRLAVLASTVGKAHALSCDFLQYGCYIEVEQVAPLTDAAMIADLHEWFDEDQGSFRVVTDAAGHVSKIIEEHGYGYLRLETPGVSDWVGEELVRLGAQRVPDGDWPALQARLLQATAENEVRRMELRAERSAMKQRYRSDGTFREEE
jgi:hypothetical protein